MSIAGLAAAGYLLTDRSNLSWSDLPEAPGNTLNLHPDERGILQLALNLRPADTIRSPGSFADWPLSVHHRQRRGALVACRRSGATRDDVVARRVCPESGNTLQPVWGMPVSGNLATRLQDEDEVEARLVPAGVGGTSGRTYRTAPDTVFRLRADGDQERGPSLHHGE